MGWAVIKGKYTQGVVELLEKVAEQDNIEVLILFPEQPPSRKPSGVWQRIRGRIAEEMPDLQHMSEAARRQEFDQLSAIIAGQIPYQSPEEFERAMRGDHYGLARY